MLQDIKAAIFDMDGTLVDSMWIWEDIDAQYLSEHNIEIPPTLKASIGHLSYQEVAEYFKKTFNLPYTKEEILAHWNSMAYDKYANEVSLKSGVKEFLKLLKSMNIKIALATSNSPNLLEACLKPNGIYDYFDVITTTSEVTRGKDFPDVYLLTAEKLGVKPENCIVFEDILAAVKGAKAANMRVVGVYDQYAKADHSEMKKLADLFIDKYEELPQKIS